MTVFISNFVAESQGRQVKQNKLNYYFKCARLSFSFSYF